MPQKPRFKVADLLRLDEVQSEALKERMWCLDIEMYMKNAHE